MEPDRTTKENLEEEVKKEFCRHVPNCIFKMLCKKACNIYEYPVVILLLADVTGFTAMTELYCTAKRKGINDLTNALNEYMSKIIQCVICCKGQIFKFAGDAILCLWEIEEKKEIYVKYKAMQALKCALTLQRNCSFYKLRKELTLNVKTFVSVGKATLIKLQNDNLSQHLLMGKPVEELQNICQCNETQEIAMTTKFWNLIKSDVLLKVPIKNGHSDDVVKIKVNDLYDDVKYVKKFMALKNSSCISANEYTQVKTEDLANFVIKPVRERIRQIEPLCYLSEMRNVTITFINVEMEHDNDNLQANLQKLFECIEKTIASHGGTFMKMLAFDKGLSFLNVFGIKETCKNKAASALESSHDILTELNKYDCVKTCSIGVSTGLTYCGVIGHEKRHEYTCIGTKVNMSARLMCKYLGVVSCDEETYLSSKLNPSCFKQLECEYLKGIAEIGNIYCYFQQSEQTDNETDNGNQTGFIFGREKEIVCVAAQVVLLMEERKGMQKKCVLFEGSDGIGKTKLVCHIFQLLKNNREWKIILTKCKLFRKNQIFGAVKVILTHLLELDSMTNEKKIEIFNKLKEEISAPLPLPQLILTELFDIKCTDSDESTILQVENSDYLSAMKMVTEAIVKMAGKKIIILVDDIHHMDAESLLIIQEIAGSKMILIVATTQTINTINHDEYIRDLLYRLIAKKNEIIHYRLQGLSKRDLRILIYYETKIDDMENELIDMLYEKTNGFPGVCKEAIAELIRFKVINLEDTSNSQCNGMIQSDGLIWNRNLLTNIFVNRKKIEELLKMNKKYIINYLRSANEMDIPVSIESFFLRQFDRLNDASKNLLLNTSILGETFSRKYMFGICKSALVRKNFNLAVKDLLENDLLKCANSCSGGKWLDYHVICRCPENVTHIPFMCKMLQFSHTIAKTVLVENMTNEAKTLRHKNAIEWLEIVSNHNWCLCSINEANVICAEEKHYSERNSNPIFAVVDQIRLQNLEQKVCSNTFDENSDSIMEKGTLKSKWFVAKEKIQLERIKLNNDCYNEIMAKAAKKSEHKLASIFRMMDAINNNVLHKNFVSYTEFQAANMRSKLKNIINMHNQTTNVANTNTVRELCKSKSETAANDYYIRLFKACENFESTIRFNCDCEKILVRIYEEILFHANILQDKERCFFYAIKEAELVLKIGRTISAGTIINKLKAMLETQNNDRLLAHYFNLLGQFYYFTSYDCSKATQNMLLCLNNLGLRFHRRLRSEALQKFLSENNKVTTDLLLNTLNIMILSSDNLEKNFFWREIANVLCSLIADRRFFSSEIMIILAHLLYKFNDLNQALELCMGCIGMPINLDKVAIIHMGCLHIAAAYIRLIKGNIEASYQLLVKADIIFEKVESLRHSVLLFPYFAFTLALTNRTERLLQLLDSYYEKIAKSRHQEKSRWFNWYWCVCLDIKESFGISVLNMDEKLIKIVNHTNILEKMDMGNYDRTGIFYALTTIARIYCHKNDLFNTMTFFMRSLKILKENKFDNNDLLIQRCLLNIAECQIRIFEHNDLLLEFEKHLFINSITCIDEHSFNFPMLCLLKGYVLRLRGFVSECRNIMQKALKSAEKSDVKIFVELIKANLHNWENCRKLSLVHIHSFYL